MTLHVCMSSRAVELSVIEHVAGGHIWRRYDLLVTVQACFVGAGRHEVIVHLAGPQIELVA